MSNKSILVKSKEAQDHIKEVHKYLNAHKASIIEMGRHFSALKKDGLWRKAFGDTDRTQTWNSFVDYEFKISGSYASRAIDVWEELKTRLGIDDALIVQADQAVVYKLLPMVKNEDIPKKQVEAYLRMNRHEFDEERAGCEDHEFGNERYGKCIQCNSFKKL